MICGDGFDVVSGWKKKRYDPLNKTLPTSYSMQRFESSPGIKLHDFNGGLKSYRGGCELGILRKCTTTCTVSYPIWLKTSWF